MNTTHLARSYYLGFITPVCTYVWMCVCVVQKCDFYAAVVAQKHNLQYFCTGLNVGILIYRQLYGEKMFFPSLNKQIECEQVHRCDGNKEPPAHANIYLHMYIYIYMHVQKPISGPLKIKWRIFFTWIYF